jgi:thiol-disulfide isomerase/thioredoxin
MNWTGFSLRGSGRCGNIDSFYFELKLFFDHKNDIMVKRIIKINNHLAKEGFAMRLSKSRGVIVFFFLIVIILSGCASNSQVTTNAPQNISQPAVKKTPFPVFDLPIPQNDAQKNYLGIAGSGRFKITQIKSPVIIIGVFSAECPHCRNTAPKVNELYQAIQARPDLKEKIKIIGILDSYAHDVDLFRARYNVPFPLFPGQESVISQKLGVNYLPKIFGVKNNDDGTMEKFYSKTGEFWFWSPNRFLEKIIKLSKLE